jgi:purine-binding chemotaxis protein CheW
MTTTHIKVGTTASALQFATFRLDQEWFGLDVLRVQEVMHPLPLTAVPRGPNYVSGLINVRGVIVTVISTKVRLGFPCTRYEEATAMNVIVNGLDGPVCLQVDEIGDVVLADRIAFAERPPTVGAQVRDLIAGVLRLDGRLITLLDAERLIAA